MEVSSARAALAVARLYGIIDLGYISAENAVAMARRMAAGGVQVIQLRAKGLAENEIVALARQIAPICDTSQIPFFINDHPGLVVPTGADGAHVGQDDVGVVAARELAGPNALIGKSTHSLDQATSAVAEGADYIGFGPLFANATKPDYPPIGLNDIRAVHGRVMQPIFCIGGVKHGNLPEILQSGARRVVVVSGILQSDDPEKYCRACRTLLSGGSLSESA